MVDYIKMKTARFNGTRIRPLKLLKLAMVTGAVILGLNWISVTSAWGQSPIPELNLEQAIPSLSNIAAEDVTTDEVSLDGYDLFAIAAPALSSDERAEITPIRERVRGIEDTLKRIVSNGIDPEDLEVTAELDNSSNLPVIYVNDQYLMTVTTLDAQLQVQRPQRWAEQLTGIITHALTRAYQERQPEFLARRATVAGVLLLVMVISSGIIAYVQRQLKARRERIADEIPPPPVVGSKSASEEADSTAVMVDTLQRHHAKRQHHDLKDIQARLLQLGQLAVWISGSFVLLGLFPYTRWLQPLAFATPLRILGIILGIYVLIRVSDVLIERFAGALAKGKFLHVEGGQRIELRVSTFSRVLKSGAVVLWIVIGLLTVLSIVGVDLVPLLAGAGIIGLAISFAAQSLIKDMINGFLILFEDQYAVGDVIVVGDVSGFVENMNLRITQLRNNEGRLITIPNSTISVVQNLSKDWSRVDLAIELAYGTNPDHALEVVGRLCEEMYYDPQWNSKMPEPPEVLGIDEINHIGILIRVWLKTVPLQQWAVAREFRRRLTLTLEMAGLSVGVPQQFLWFRSSLDLDVEQLNDDHRRYSESTQR